MLCFLVLCDLALTVLGFALVTGLGFALVTGLGFAFVLEVPNIDSKLPNVFVNFLCALIYFLFSFLFNFISFLCLRFESTIGVFTEGIYLLPEPPLLLEVLTDLELLDTELLDTELLDTELLDTELLDTEGLLI